MLLEILSNHDDDGNKNPTNLHIWQWKLVVFIFFTFWRRSRSFYDMKWPVLQVCGQRERMMTNVQFVFLCPKRWFQINSRTVRTHFSSIMTLNNWKMIAATRSHIFRWRSRFRRRRVCVSPLFSLVRNQSETLWSPNQSDWPLFGGIFLLNSFK